MGSFSIWHWVIILLILAIFGIPVAKIITKAGFSRWWTIAFFIPTVNIVALWVFAFVRWPVGEHHGDARRGI